MTREDAFEIWLPIIKMGVKSMPECSEALDMAITALKQEPCADCISRQAVLNLAKFDGRDGLGSIIHAFDVEQLPPVTPTEKVGQWIPVSERLPEDKQSVLVWCPQYKNIYCAYLEKEQWWIFGAFVQIVPNGVVAWMPLPNPYKASPTGAEEENE